MLERLVRKFGCGSLILFVLGNGLCPGAPAWAGAKGTMKALGIVVTTKQDTSKVEDKPEHSILYIEQDGINIDQSGGKFLDKARYQLTYMSDSSGMVSGGYKTFTEADGSKVFAKFEDTEQAPPVYKGKFEFIGGTGKYTGIKGHGTFTYNMLADTVGWDVMEAEYEIP